MNPISVIAPIYNEEEFLEKSFNAVKPYVDEFVVADQGSTDRSVEIAKCYTDKILLFPRVYYSYAYIHEMALLAKNEWVLRIDPDEKWDESLFEQFSELIVKDVDMFKFNMTYGSETRFYNPRLWRKSKVIWTDTFDAIPYFMDKLKVESVEGGKIVNQRTRDSVGVRYRIEGAKRLLARYGDTKVEPYVNFCEYYQEIIEGKRL